MQGIRRGYVLFLAAILVPGATLARDPEPPSAADGFNWSDQTNQRALNGHFFLPSQVVQAPFTSTHFGSSTAFGYGRFDVTVQDDNGATQDLRLKVLGIQQGLDLQVAMGAAGPASFALRIRSAGNALAGVSADAALYLPLTVGYDYGVGFLAKPWGNRYFQFAVSFDFQRGTAYQVSPLVALQNSIAQGAITTQGLLSTSSTTDLYPGVALALSPYKVVGLMSSLRYDWQHVDGGATDHLLDWAIALSLDLNGAFNFPLGLQGVYELVKSFTGIELMQHYGGGGLWYTGRRDLALGVEAVVTKSDAGGVRQMLVQGQFRLRYYW